MSMIQLKLKGGMRVRIAASKVEFISEQSEGTLLSLDSGEELMVNESYQTVSNRLAKADSQAEDQPVEG